MAVIVTACSAFGVTVSEAKTESMCLQTKGRGEVSFTINAAGQVCKQTIEFACLGGAITADGESGIEITRRLQRAWACFQRYKMEIYDRPGVRLRLRVRLLKAEVIETLPYGCMMWNPNRPEYDRLRQGHHCMLLRCLGWRKRKRDDHILSYAHVLASFREYRSDSAQTEAIVWRIRSAYGGGASATEGDVWGPC